MGRYIKALQDIANQEAQQKDWYDDPRTWIIGGDNDEVQKKFGQSNAQPKRHKRLLSSPAQRPKQHRKQQRKKTGCPGRWAVLLHCF